jgi:hypothetical protein
MYRESTPHLGNRQAKKENSTLFRQKQEPPSLPLRACHYGPATTGLPLRACLRNNIYDLDAMAGWQSSGPGILPSPSESPQLRPADRQRTAATSL